MMKIITNLAFVFAAFDLVISGNPVFLVEPGDMVVGVGATMSLRCSATGDPTPTIDWIKAAVGAIWYPGANDGRLSVKDDGTLIITSARKEDAGVYTCEAKNVHGRITSPSSVNIFAKPSFLVRPRGMILEEGGTVHFSCSTTGTPSPTVYWTKHGGVVPMFPKEVHGRFFVKDDGTLVIRSVKKEDSGSYECHAFNYHGYINVTANLEVKDAHQLAEPLLVPPVGLKASAQSSTTVLLTWYDVTLPGSTDTRYYTVRYHPVKSGKWTYMYSNTTTPSAFISGLTPSTQYEFSARTFIGSRSTQWSMTTVNKTMD